MSIYFQDYRVTIIYVRVWPWCCFVMLHNNTPKKQLCKVSTSLFPTDMAQIRLTSLISYSNSQVQGQRLHLDKFELLPTDVAHTRLTVQYHIQNHEFKVKVNTWTRLNYFQQMWPTHGWQSNITFKATSSTSKVTPVQVCTTSTLMLEVCIGLYNLKLLSR